ncbi:hypothetical protein BDR26DRAFT_858049 [Obelidium mucronatum]|nr:hypothetical protein BDR26DRAFT_858049 [Obelidium mucronatum]
MTSSEQRRIINAAESYVRESLKKTDAVRLAKSNGPFLMRATAVRIASAIEADLFTVELTALLHDVYDEKLTGKHRSASDISSLICELLVSMECPADDASRVGLLVSKIGYKQNAFASAEANKKYFDEMTPEQACVQDADTLDAIGAIGIARAFAFGGSRDRPIYSPDELKETGQFIASDVELTEAEYRRKDRGSSVAHFFEKLLKLKGRLLTEEGKRIGQQRHTIMVQFLENLGLECVGSQ